MYICVCIYAQTFQQFCIIFELYFLVLIFPRSIILISNSCFYAAKRVLKQHQNLILIAIEGYGKLALIARLNNCSTYY